VRQAGLEVKLSFAIRLTLEVFLKTARRLAREEIAVAVRSIPEIVDVHGAFAPPIQAVGVKRLAACGKHAERRVRPEPAKSNFRRNNEAAIGTGFSLQPR